MVEDPQLARHLAHWGINMLAMEKTEATMAELQLAMNKSFEYSRITGARAPACCPLGAGLPGAGWLWLRAARWVAWSRAGPGVSGFC